MAGKRVWCFGFDALLTCVSKAEFQNLVGRLLAFGSNIVLLSTFKINTSWILQQAFHFSCFNEQRNVKMTTATLENLSNNDGIRLDLERCLHSSSRARVRVSARPRIRPSVDCGAKQRVKGMQTEAGMRGI